MSTEVPDYRQYYNDRLSRYKYLLTEVEFTVKQVMPSDVHIHSMHGRIKELKSFLEKFERKGYVNVDQIEDVVGYRIVCLSLSDLSRVENVIRASFDVLREEDKIEQVDDASSFGYMSKHFVCQLDSRTVAGPRYDNIKQMRFEIQCRTILMDAWANVSHYLAYKGDASIPSHLRRDFYALSGLFYIADRHFELFFNAAMTSEKSALSAPTEESETAPMNLDTVQAMLARIYPERTRATRGQVSAFLEETASAGYETLKGLEEALVRGENGAMRYEADLPPALIAGEKYSDVGFARMALAIADLEYAQKYYSGEKRFEKYRK